MTRILTHLHSGDDLSHTLNHLAARDEGMCDALTQCGVPALRRRAPGFEGLAAIITGQQVSTHAARAIWNRLETGLGEVSYGAVSRAADEDLAACGLSRPKIRTLRALVEAVESGALDFVQLDGADDETVHTTLTSIKGIGPWTADIFLLFCLGRADAWPAGDLALMEAIRIMRGLPDRPKARTASCLPIAGGHTAGPRRICCGPITPLRRAVPAFRISRVNDQAPCGPSALTALTG
ncbi:MAG: DNA-3-methyladenine glycosylase 2 family protein [Tepidamorphaceae bacterium]